MNDTLELYVHWYGERGFKRSTFSEISQNKGKIRKMVLRWTYNSYAIDMDHPAFVINGGKMVQFPNFQRCEVLTPMLVRRNRQEVGMNGGKVGPQETSYLLGWEGKEDGEKHELYVHISPDGGEFEWKQKR